MAQDDLVPDGALAKRAEVLAQAAQSLYDIVLTRSHLRETAALLGSARSDLLAAKGGIEEKSHDDPDQVKYRSRIRKEGFPTYSGVWFYPFDPKPEEVRHDDIVMGLLHECRYNGQVPRFLSVAEHSVKVAAMAEHLIMLDVRAGRVAEEYAFHAALYGLLHDAHEAYLGDIISPLKKCIMHASGEAWEVIEGRVQAAILDAYGLPPPTPEVEAVVDLADRFALYCEAIVLKSNSQPEEWPGMKVPPAEVQAVGFVRREWPEWAKVRALYDGEVRRLVATLGGVIPGDRTSHEQKLREHVQAKIEAPLHQAARQSGSWRNKVQSASVDIPPELMNEPEFRKEQ
jgi:hypothetical protein